jgi:hypothetical protein
MLHAIFAAIGSTPLGEQRSFSYTRSISVDAEMEGCRNPAIWKI